MYFILDRFRFDASVGRRAEGGRAQAQRAPDHGAPVHREHRPGAAAAAALPAAAGRAAARVRRPGNHQSNPPKRKGGQCARLAPALAQHCSVNTHQFKLVPSVSLTVEHTHSSAIAAPL